MDPFDSSSDDDDDMFTIMMYGYYTNERRRYSSSTNKKRMLNKNRKEGYEVYIMITLRIIVYISQRFQTNVSFA